MLTPGDFERLLVVQQELESESLAKGAKRFRDMVQRATQAGRSGSVGGGRKLMQDGVVALEEAIVAWHAEQTRKGRRGLKHHLTPWIASTAKEATEGKGVEPSVAAYMTLKVIMDCIGRHMGAATVARMLSDLILDELRFVRFEREATGFYSYTVGTFVTKNYSQMARNLGAALKAANCNACYKLGIREGCTHLDMSELAWTPAMKTHIGLKLIDLALASTGLFTLNRTVRKVRRKAVREVILTAAPETTAWIDARNGALESLYPVNLPMVVPPLAWGPGQKGGYRFALRGKYALVRKGSAADKKALSTREMPVVYAAVNRIQETPWRVNPAVMTLVQAVVDRGGALVGIPGLEDAPYPPRPADYDHPERVTRRAARRVYGRMAAKVKTKNLQRAIAAKEFFNTYTTAMKVAGERAIFFPVSLDFRGRVYAIPNYLQPQGSDLSKALLTFAHGKPMGHDGADWLALHGANCMDECDGVKLKKATLQERMDWVVTNTDRIMASADAPLESRWWMQADKPLQFYAFCVEWAGYIRAVQAGNGAGYVCSLPVSQDGTCNGLQHFAAMLRDEVGGAAVNVVPSERPQDIYQRVADKVMARVEREAATNDFARLWLTSGLVGRKLAKRPTMTFGYGSKRYGFAEQLVAFVTEADRDVDGAHFGVARRVFTLEQQGQPRLCVGPACGYMSLLIWEALWETVIAASRAMDWMQQAARGVVQAQQCVEWTVRATNFPVRQGYMSLRARQIETMLAGKMLKPRLYEETELPNSMKQCNAIAPNFVHSLDAAALMLTVDAASQEGVECFGMVHDSYATLPADAAILAQATRQQFYWLYSRHDVIADLAGDLQRKYVAPETMPVPPEKGALDLGGVLVSDYFFS